MDFRVNNLSHYPLTENAINSIKDSTLTWLSRTVNWIQSSLENKIVASTTLIAVNVLALAVSVGIVATLIGERDLSYKEEWTAMSMMLYIQTIQIFAFTRIVSLPLSPLAMIGISVATVAAAIFRPDQWIYEKFRGR